jgi:uncharacterized protein YndB with AHSA1/START domain
MSIARRQAMIDAPPERLWELVGDPRRHPEWWPRVVEVRGERFDEGSNYAQVTRAPTGRHETTMRVERLEDLREIHLRCETTGTYAHWLLTEAQGGTFVEVEFGMDPEGRGRRIFDAALGKLYFGHWLDQSLTALEAAAERPQPAAA